MHFSFKLPMYSIKKNIYILLLIIHCNALQSKMSFSVNVSSWILNKDLPPAVSLELFLLKCFLD